jgi:cysteinyl-tRNA synthetase
MPLRLFNTLTRRLDAFEPLVHGRVTMYTCGPTVWNYAHIGNFRTFVFEDVLRRYLAFSGYAVTQVMNLTDVDDRTINAARAAGTGLAQHTAPFTAAFHEDRAYLRIEDATHYPAATTHIAGMVDLVTALLEKGVAYQGDDGSVYFAIAKFPAYGRLSRIDTREIRVGARVASDEYAKEDARDFVLWKAAKPDDEAVGAAWDAPFGRGRPGWHLECSAMARQYLGDTIDIHAGGVDLIFPHHEDEIAQSEAATGRPFARYWLHGEFLLVEGTKMSKRYGNFLTARDLRDAGVDPAAVRLLFCQTHYRRQLNFSDDALKAAAAGAQRLAEFRDRLCRSAGPDALPPEWTALLARLDAAFRAAMDEDLDLPRALAAIMDFVRDANRQLDAAGLGPAARGAVLQAFDRVAGVLQVVPATSAVTGAASEAERQAHERARERAAARGRREWARADALRADILALGFDVRDTKDGGFELRRLTE